MAKTERRKLGDIGENIACEFLKRRGFEVLDKNYLKKWGEIDIVAKKGEVIRFVEVKSVRVSHLPPESVSQETSDQRGQRLGGSGASSSYRPEDNMHPGKLKRLVRTMQTYMLEKKLLNEFQLDLITVRIDEEKRVGRAEMIENIIVS